MRIVDLYVAKDVQSEDPVSVREWSLAIKEAHRGEIKVVSRAELNRLVPLAAAVYVEDGTPVKYIT